MKKIILAILAIAILFLVVPSCKKEDDSTTKKHEVNSFIVKKEHFPISTDRLSPNYAESTTGIPKIEAVTLNDSNAHKLQIYMMYWPKADTSYMHLEYRQFGTTTTYSSTANLIDGIGPTFGFWHVFQDINNLNSGTLYEVRVVGVNIYGTKITPWHIYSTGY